MTTFTVASNEFIGGGREKAEYQVKGEVYRWPETREGSNHNMLAR